MRTLVVLVLAVVLAPRTEAISLRRQCLLQCRGAITDCKTAGGRRGRCRRDTLRRCRHVGVAICVRAPATTTTTTTTTTLGGGGSTSTTTTSTLGGGGTTTTTLELINGCNRTTALDLRDQARVTVRFGDILGLHYEPACYTVSPGTLVTFEGAFTQHPLIGGTVLGGVPLPDPGSPFTPTRTGTTKTFTMPGPGVCPFYCDFHGPIGMEGVAFVSP